eukprot:15464981-Alexandrium_andersonii.AAC.1
MAPCRKPPHPQSQASSDKADTTTLRSGEVASTIGHPSFNRPAARRCHRPECACPRTEVSPFAMPGPEPAKYAAPLSSSDDEDG